MSPFIAARMYLGVDLREAGSPADSVALVRTAARRGLDFVALPGQDAMAALATIAPLVSGMGLIPAVPVAEHPVHAAWELVRGAGTWADVDAALARDPGQLLVVRADEPEALPVAGRWADVVRIAAPSLDAAHAAVARVRAAVAAAGRHPDDVVVLLDVEVRLTGDRRAARNLPPASSLRVAGPPEDLASLIGAAVRFGVADGLTLVPLDPAADLLRIADDLVPLLAGRGLFRPGRSGTLRARFGLDRYRAAAS